MIVHAKSYFGRAGTCWCCLLAFTVQWGISPVGAGEAASSAKPPDIVVIMIDTLRADRLGCYGNPLDTSPTIDAIAARGVLFADAVAPAPWTCPSVASVFTALYPARHGVMDHEGRYAREDDHAVTDVLDMQHVTLAEGLSGAGYQTAAFVANRWLQDKFGYAQGFEHYDLVTARQTYPSGQKVNEQVAAWLPNRDPARPVFLYVHYMDAHGPYNAPAEYRSRFVTPLSADDQRGKLTELPENVRGFDARRLIDADRSLLKYREYWLARYDAGVRYCDDHVSALAKLLTDAAIWEDATVVIVADHGEEFGEHQGNGHGFSLHAHQLQAALVFRAPWIKEPRRIDATVSLVDLATTLWDLAEIDVPVATDGRSLLPILQGSEPPTSAVAFGQAVKRRPEIVSAQIDGRKLIFDLNANSSAYYDLRADALEQAPADGPADEVSMQLRANLMAWVSRTRALSPPKTPPPRVEIDPETERLLKSLGYLQDPDDEVEGD